MGGISNSFVGGRKLRIQSEAARFLRLSANEATHNSLGDDGHEGGHQP